MKLSNSICAEVTRSDERTNHELGGVLDALDTPTDRRAFDINAEVHALITSGDFETTNLIRDHLRHLRDFLSSQDVD